MVHSCLTKLVVLLLVLSLKVSVALSVPIQDVDYTREEYEAYSSCTTLDNSEDKQKCLLEFIQAHPKLSLVVYGISEYGRSLNQQIQNESIAKLCEAVFMYITAGLLLYVVFWLSKSISDKRLSLIHI